MSCDPGETDTMEQDPKISPFADFVINWVRVTALVVIKAIIYTFIFSVYKLMNHCFPYGEEPDQDMMRPYAIRFPFMNPRPIRMNRAPNDSTTNLRQRHRRNAEGPDFPNRPRSTSVPPSRSNVNVNGDQGGSGDSENAIPENETLSQKSFRELVEATKVVIKIINGQGLGEGRSARNGDGNQRRSPPPPPPPDAEPEIEPHPAQ